MPYRRQIKHVARQTSQHLVPLLRLESFKLLPQIVEQILLIDLAEHESVKCQPGLEALVLRCVTACAEERNVTLDPNGALLQAAFVDPVRKQAMHVFLCFVVDHRLVEYCRPRVSLPVVTPRRGLLKRPVACDGRSNG